MFSKSIIATTLLCLSTFSVAAPMAAPAPEASDISQLAERAAASTPWLLSNIVVYDAPEESDDKSYVSFTFQDTRNGLGLTTKCRRQTKGDLSVGLSGKCQDKSVGFNFDNGKFTITRRWTDNNVGTFPMNQVIATGSKLAELEGADSEPKTLATLGVPILTLVA